MRIVFDARSVTDHFLGIGRYGSGLTQALVRQPGVELTLLVDPRARRALHALPDVPCVDAPYGFVWPTQQWAVPRMLEALGAEVYHSPYYLMPYLLPCPGVVTMYDLIPLHLPDVYSVGFRLAYRWAHRLAGKAAREVIAISRATAADLLELGLPREKVTPIWLGVGPEFAPCAADEVTRVRARYGLPERFALYVGTNKPHKNLRRLVEAWARVDGWPLVVAGEEDPRYPMAPALAAASGARVLSIGCVSGDDLPALYTAASLFVFPSLYEGFGLPVLEAMACGTPVICSNIPALTEVAGDAACLVDPLDAENLVRAVGEVMESVALRSQMREKGLSRAALYSWDWTARKTLEVYQRSLGG